MLDDREVRKFALHKDAIVTIGRAQDNDIVINNLALSRRHAQVEFVDGAYEIVDLGSQNGVYSGNERVKGAKRLADNETISLGTYKFAFHLESSDQPQTSSTRDASETQRLAGEQEQSVGPFLVLTFNEVELQRFPLKGSLCQIGRAKECDIQIPERRLSRRHCEIECQSDGRYVVRDLGSQNGTFVNRRRIRGDHEIENRDILNFAEYAVMFLLDEGDYEGADADERPVSEDYPSPMMSSEIAGGETEMPPAYSREYGYSDYEPSVEPIDYEEEDDTPVPPVALRRQFGGRAKKATRDQDISMGEPIIERPNAARGRKRREEVQPTDAPRPAPPKKNKSSDSSPAVRELDNWYNQRDASALHSGLEEQFEDLDEDFSSDLVPRGNSSISQVLSTMMIDKQELNKNMKMRSSKSRDLQQFGVVVTHGEEIIFSGPLRGSVTIMGTDEDADICLRGRYVAGRHSLLVVVRDSLLLVRLGSSSAARVNGLPKLQAFLKIGDTVQIDETEIEIVKA